MHWHDLLKGKYLLHSAAHVRKFYGSDGTRRVNDFHKSSADVFEEFGRSGTHRRQIRSRQLCTLWLRVGDIKRVRF